MVFKSDSSCGTLGSLGSLVLRLAVVVWGVEGYLVDRCWDSEFTRARCCQGNDPACWQSPFTFETCCTGDPLCWSDDLSYARCCLGESEPGCWNGLFTYGRCCTRDLVRLPDDCRNSEETRAFVSLATEYVASGRVSAQFSAGFKQISDFWPCEEAVVLGLLYSMESNAHCGWECAQPYLETIRRIMAKSVNSDTATRGVVEGYLRRVLSRLDQVGRLSSPSSLDIVFPHCGEDVSWLVDGLRVRWHYMEESLSKYTRFIYVNKCPLRPLRPEVGRQLEQLRSMFSEFVVVDVYESIIGQECTGNLEYLVRFYDKFSEYALFVHPDMEEHIPSTEVFYDSIFFVTNSYFASIFDPIISFLPLGLNFLSPFWARHERYRHAFKRFHAALFSLSSAALSPDPAEAALYCCAQFLVKRAAMRFRPHAFYFHALNLINNPGQLAAVFGFPGHGLSQHDFRGKTHCEFMMLEWQLMFGEAAKADRREHQPHLPLYYKSRNLQPS